MAAIDTATAETSGRVIHVPKMRMLKQWTSPYRAYNSTRLAAAASFGWGFVTAARRGIKTGPLDGRAEG
jgi:hypothetical protein